MTDIPCLALHPAVCAVEDGYEILLLCTCRALASVTIGETTYTDSNNGVMRTDTLVHKVRVPAAALNGARHYRAACRPLQLLPQAGTNADGGIRFPARTGGCG